MPDALCVKDTVAATLAGRARLAVLCGPALNLSALYYADLTALIQRSKPLGLQPPAEMIYPCPPPSLIPHSDSSVVCFAHPSGLTEEERPRRRMAAAARGDCIKLLGRR